MANPAPGFRDHPDHTLALEPGAMVIVQLGDTLVAESRTAILLSEDHHPLRAYLPRGDVFARLTASEKTTHCPFKGDTTYFDVTVGENTLPDAAWSYETPYDEMAAIAGSIAFDERFHITIAY